MASHGLPMGLINSNTVAVSNNFAENTVVSEEALAQLWRVFSTARNNLPQGNGRRLENFFWRAWASQRLGKEIDGTQIAMLFRHVSEAGNLNTSSRSTVLLPAVDPTSDMESGRATPITTDVQAVIQSPVAVVDRNSSQSSLLTPEGPSASHWLVVKDHDTKSNSSPETVIFVGTSLQSDDTDQERRRNSNSVLSIPKRQGAENLSWIKTARIESAEPTVIANTSQDQIWEQDDTTALSLNTLPLSLAKPTKKKATFVALTASSKRRPFHPRRKSSQTSTSGTVPATLLKRPSALSALSSGESPSKLCPGNQGQRHSTVSSGSPPVPSTTIENASRPSTSGSFPRPKDLPLMSIPVKTAPTSSVITSIQVTGNMVDMANLMTPQQPHRPPPPRPYAGSLSNLKGEGRVGSSIGDEEPENIGPVQSSASERDLTHPHALWRSRSQSQVQLASVLEHDFRSVVERGQEKGKRLRSFFRNGG